MVLVQLVAKVFKHIVKTATRGICSDLGTAIVIPLHAHSRHVEYKIKSASSQMQ